MGFEQVLSQLRKQKKLSQEELAKAVGVHANVLGRYERGEAKPSIDIATNIAQALGVSLDFLTGKEEQQTDKDILDKVHTIQKLPLKDREHILFTLDAMIRDAKARSAYA